MNRVYILFPTFIVIFLLGFFPALTTVYGVGDDYNTLTHYFDWSTNSLLFYSNLRPIYGILGDISFDLIDGDFSLFWVLRLSFVIFLAWFCYLYAAELERLGLPKLHGILIALVVGLSPASQALVSYGIMNFTPLGLICSLYAYRLISDIALDNGFKIGSQYSFKLLGSVALLMGAMSIYTVYVLFFWSLILAEIIIRRYELKVMLERCFFYGFVFVVASLLYYGFTYYFLPSWLDFEVTARANQHNSIIMNFLYIVVRPVRDVFNLFHLTYYGPLFGKVSPMVYLPDYVIAFTVAAISFGGIYVSLKSKFFAYRLFFLAIITGLFFASYSIHLFLDASFSPYRTQFALYASAVTLLYFGVLGMQEKFGYRNVVRNVFCVIVVASSICCFLHLQKLIVGPLSKEWRMVSEKVLQANKNNKKILIISPHKMLYKDVVTYYDDFGVLVSMTSPDRIPMMAKVALRDVNASLRDIEMMHVILKKNEPIPVFEGEVIDLRLLY